jgi:hypothetical protein
MAKAARVVSAGHDMGAAPGFVFRDTFSARAKLIMVDALWVR